jgi:hypothetical protein
VLALVLLGRAPGLAPTAGHRGVSRVSGTFGYPRLSTRPGAHRRWLRAPVAGGHEAVLVRTVLLRKVLFESKRQDHHRSLPASRTTPSLPARLAAGRTLRVLAHQALRVTAPPGSSAELRGAVSRGPETPSGAHPGRVTLESVGAWPMAIAPLQTPGGPSVLGPHLVRKGLEGVSVRDSLHRGISGAGPLWVARPALVSVVGWSLGSSAEHSLKRRSPVLGGPSGDPVC